MKRTLVLLFLVAFALQAFAQEGRRFQVGVGFGFYFPQNDRIKDVYGDTWPDISFATVSAKPNKWRFGTDLAIRSRSRNGNEALLIPLTFGVSRSFGQEGQSVQPYASLRAGIYYGRVRSSALNVNETKIGTNANAAVGVTFGRNFYVEARYDLFSKFEGLDFSGIEVSAGVRLFEF